MNTKIMTVVQCWDDGVTTDIRLTEVLRRYGAKASFNLCFGLHEKHRAFRWRHRDSDVFRLGRDELRGVYDGFTVANHSMTHPRLDLLPEDEARREIVEGREALQQHFGQRVAGFAYPFGAHSDTLMRLVREAGHTYARTIESDDYRFPPDDAMLFHPCCHFLAPDLLQRYESAREWGVFYFWGHSYEMVADSMWDEFERVIETISADQGSRWGDLEALFDDSS